MTPQNVRAAPHLPLLSLGQCVEVFRASGIPKNTLARVSGFTRMQIIRWYRGSTARALPRTLEYVSELAYRMLRAEQAGKMPPAACRDIARWAQALNDSDYPVALQDAQIEDVVPPAWTARLNLQPGTQDAAA